MKIQSHQARQKYRGIEPEIIKGRNISIIKALIVPVQSCLPLRSSETTSELLILSSNVFGETWH